MIKVDEDWQQFYLLCNKNVNMSECTHPNGIGKCLEKKYCPRVAKPKKAPSVLWRKSFEEYQKEAEAGMESVLTDSKWVDQMREDYPDVDVSGTVDKSYKDFWSTEMGWLNKKKRRGATINWKATYGFAIKNEKLQVKRKSRYEI